MGPAQLHPPTWIFRQLLHQRRRITERIIRRKNMQQMYSERQKTTEIHRNNLSETITIRMKKK